MSSLREKYKSESESLKEKLEKERKGWENERKDLN
jgi:hypothetical protein